MAGRLAKLHLSRGFLADKDKSTKGEVCCACNGNGILQASCHSTRVLVSRDLKQNVTGDTFVH